MRANWRPWTREGSGGAAGPPFFSVVAVGLLSLGLIVWSDSLWRASFRRTVPLLDNLMQTRDSLADGYVWLEELLRGNRTVEPETVSDAYNQAVAALDDSLAGRSAIPNLSGTSPVTPALVGELKKYGQLSRRARDIATERWTGAARGERAEVPDVQLLSAFHGLSLVARATTARVHDEIVGVIAAQTRLRDLTLVLWSSLLVGVSWGLFTAGRRRALAEDALRQAHVELEQKVEERTAELRSANGRLHAEIQERGRAEEALRRSEGELRVLSTRLLAFQEDERARLATELHDGVVQALVAAMFRMELSIRQVGKGGPDAAVESGDAALRMLRGTVDDVRKIYMDLRPSMLDELGLLPAAAWICRQFQEAAPQIRVSSEWAVTETEVPQALKIVCYRIIQESLDNIARHSDAQAATARLRRYRNELELTVEDDGVGFDVDQVLSSGPESVGLGLRSMRQRAESSGGSFAVESTPGGGTRVRATWPLPEI